MHICRIIKIALYGYDNNGKTLKAVGLEKRKIKRGKWDLINAIAISYKCISTKKGLLL